MEHDKLSEMLKVRGLYSEEKLYLLLEYLRLVFEFSKNINLTGQTSLNDMIQVLLVKSVEPLMRESVPRGTLFADMGTGAGFPGVPLGILFEESRGVLFDAVGKKIRFIKDSITSLGINNLSAESVRLEDYGHAEGREGFDLVLSRAMGNPFFCLELGAPLLKVGGRLYLYSNLDLLSLDREIINHALSLGMKGVSSEDHRAFGFEREGLLFVKESETPSSYPRRFAKLKREAGRFDTK